MHELHFVSHTHWDREWYHPAGRFRQRLVALVDELLDDPPTNHESFLLDGQGIVLEDYLAVRPERGAELAALLRAGRLEAGPWYVLADELIPSGEALVRNLFAGQRVLRALRAESPPVLYSPDAFGHPAAFPAIAAGFGLPLVMLWRGYGGARWPAGDAARWVAPDGSAVTLWHFPPDGYEAGSNLPTDDAGAAARWPALREALVARATRGVSLLPNGADHHARQEGHDAAFVALGRAMGPGHALVHSSLRRFAAALLAGDAALPTIQGELRDSYGYTWTLQGTFASRAAQKRGNARAERLLLGEAEPWSALARLQGAPSRRALVQAAWRVLLACHPHDTLCGCSVDEVARAMDARLDDAITQGQGIVEDAILDVVGHDRGAVRVARDPRPTLVLLNRLPREREGVAFVDWMEWLADVPVGPGSAGRVPEPPFPAAATGSPLPAHAQALAVTERVELTESPRHYPAAHWVRTTRVAMWVPSLPGFTAALRDPADIVTPLPLHVAPAVAREGSLDNGLLHLEIDASGTVALSHEDTGVVLPDLLAFEDRIDLGDLYTPSIRDGDRPVAFRGARVVHEGPLHAVLEAAWVVSAGDAELPLVVQFSLNAGDARLGIAIRGDNRSDDHRLRVRVRTGARSRDHWADAAFGLVRREPLVVPAAERARELPLPTNPLHRYLSRFGEAHGATLCSDGLAEYEAMDDGTVAVTLLRAVGQLSRGNLPQRPGHAGWPAATPEAQSHGPFEARLALLLHAATRDDALVAGIEREAADFLLPLGGTMLRRTTHASGDFGGLALHGEGLACSAIKESEDGESVVLRCVNLLDREVQGAWVLGVAPAGAQLARLDETPLALLAVAGSSIPFTAPPRGIVTVLVPL